MSTENHEQRIAELEATTALLSRCMVSMIIGFGKAADYQKDAMVQILELMSSQENVNEQIFRTAALGIPDERVKSALEDGLNKMLFRRDQTDAMIQALKNAPAPSSATAALIPPAALPTPPASPAA
jgi:hypothetical protein